MEERFGWDKYTFSLIHLINKNLVTNKFNLPLTNYRSDCDNLKN